MVPSVPSSTPSPTDYVRPRIDRSQGRSLVMSSLGIAATEHPLASQAAATILGAGGHAVDAAIAANAVMGVVAPMSNGVGGDLFAIVYDASTDQLHGLNASGWAPAGLTIDVLRAQGITAMPQTGGHSVTVPGAAAGWDVLRQRFGRKSFSQLLAPAIAAAETGVPVAELIALEWAGSMDALSGYPSAARTYLPGGRAPRAGEIFKNTDLAGTLREIAEHGPRTVYGGKVGRRLVECVRSVGGCLSEADLEAFAPEWVEPLTTTYRGWQVYELPPNGQGIATLLMLNILEEFPLRAHGHNSVDALHAMIEAKKLAYADLDRYVGDPAQTSVPVDALLSKEYARERAGLIDMRRASAGFAPGTLPPSGGDTIYLSVVDADGNIVSLIQSNFANFGSALVPEKSGFALQNRGGLFTLKPAHANTLGPRKRPLHTIIPGFMRKDEVRIAFGIMGGWNQAQAHAQFVSNVADHGLNIQAALEAARFTKLTFDGRDVIVERRVPPVVCEGLRARAHELDVHGDFSSMVGGGQSVMRDAKAGVNYGGSDPRKDGAAIPQPLGVRLSNA
jgi:gamma-glutamyltranspeptidase/glutathione hydrolase